VAGVVPLMEPLLHLVVVTAGVGEAYSVGDLAHLLWGCAMLGVVPRQGLINSFAGGSWQPATACQAYSHPTLDSP
jgi:hypothetical protein